MEPRKKYDITALLKIAKENRDKIFNNSDIDEKLSDAAKFCLSFNIKEGGNKVFSGIIYQAYLSAFPSPSSKVDFFTDFDTLIECNSVGNKRYYMLNYKPAQLLNSALKRKVRVINDKEE